MSLKSLLLSLCILVLTFSSYAQTGNMGIGTTTPHPSAILDLESIRKGFKIPYTDTNAVIAFANSFTPPQPIPNGLLIFQKGAENFYYYAEPINRWVPLSGLAGIQGPQGDTGDAGPMGPPGHFSTFRSGNGVPTALPGDTCDTYYIDLLTSNVYKFRCPFGWSYAGGPYTSRLQEGETISLTSTDSVVGFEIAGANSNQRKSLTGLKHTIVAPPGHTAFAFIHAYGAVKKLEVNDDYNYAEFDIWIGTPTTVAQQFRQRVSMGPTGPAPEFHNENVSWSISLAVDLGTGNTIEVKGSQDILDKDYLGDVLLCNREGTENEAHLNIIVFYVRN